MAFIHLPVESDRLKTLALMTMITLVAAVVVGVEFATMPRLRGEATSTAPVGPEHGPVDIGFAQDMSLHHEQALTMAQMALAKGSPRVRQLAQGIVNQQLKEVGYMQGWLMLWQAPGIAPTDEMHWMRDAYGRSPRRDPAYERFIDNCIQGRGMPGLASPAELDALAAVAQAEAFDAMFLALMVRHHQGAVVMARFASEYAQLDAVRGFARAVSAEQQQELMLMLRWLKTH
ncbi:MAG: DUF305 domain-containing protein [Aquabacterium sp.]|uniref:DUF305 domain-containing protein n=1 Tax=Aquabacterium sp. TaxID=1872578 RepID=UPI0025C43906|nr:DUF305 domain-containing protein [Aquabacterium sp.]MBI3382094.1 DUF305 domain-containing protein [Aquabacterium sp.]